MAKKHVDAYYEEVCKQYYEFIEEIKEFESCVEDNVIAPETLDNIKSMLEPLKNNWQMLNYVMFLLNKPARNSKGQTYEKQNKKKLKDCITDKQVYSQNKKCIDDMKNLTKSMRS